jgi:hypothetical protein
MDTLRAHGLIVDFLGRNAAGLFVEDFPVYDLFIPFVCPDNQVGMILFQIERYEHYQEVRIFNSYTF